MKIAINVKNLSKFNKPSKNDLILYDGKEWYLTTKDEVFKEYQDKVNAKLNEFDLMIKDNNEFKENINKELANLAKIIKDMIKGEGK